eukprot:1799771-Pyramimonas_sp.AAC.1
MDSHSLTEEELTSRQQRAKELILAHKHENRSFSRIGALDGLDEDRLKDKLKQARMAILSIQSPSRYIQL